MSRCAPFSHRRIPQFGPKLRDSPVTGLSHSPSELYQKQNTRAAFAARVFILFNLLNQKTTDSRSLFAQLPGVLQGTHQSPLVLLKR